MLWNIIGIAAASITSIAFIPQIIKMHRTRSVGDISGLTMLQFFSGVMLWLLYGIHLGDIIIICANLAMLVTLIIKFFLFIKYRKQDQ